MFGFWMEWKKGKRVYECMEYAHRRPKRENFEKVFFSQGILVSPNNPPIQLPIGLV